MTMLSQNTRPFTAKAPKQQQAIVIVPPKMTDLKEIPVKSYEDVEVEYGEDCDRICEDHESLIKVILEEEEELI